MVAPVQMMAQPMSAKLKPLPVTVTVVATGPAIGESIIDGPVTVNVVEIDPCCTWVASDIVTVCAP
jgi:hypothetical protein